MQENRKSKTKIPIFKSLSGLCFAAILVGHPMIVVISIVFAMSIVEVLISVLVYRAVLIGKKQAEIAVAEG